MPRIKTKTEHWVHKIIPNDNESYEERLLRLTLDSYLSNIMHAIDNRAPTGRLNSVEYESLEYKSRMYPYDNAKSVDFHKLSLHHLTSGIDDTYKLAAVKSLAGLLNSLIFSIIIGNCDCRLDNLTAYQLGNGSFACTGFDFEYTNLYKHPYQNHNNFKCKEFTPREIESIILGTQTASNENNVAEALVEIIEGFGKRASQKGDHKNITTIKPILTNCVKHELDAICKQHNIAKSDPHMHSKALVIAFKKVLNIMEKQALPAYRTTMENLLELKQPDECYQLEKNSLHQVPDKNSDTKNAPQNLLRIVANFATLISDITQQNNLQHQLPQKEETKGLSNTTPKAKDDSDQSLNSNFNPRSFIEQYKTKVGIPASPKLLRPQPQTPIAAPSALLKSLDPLSTSSNSEDNFCCRVM